MRTAEIDIKAIMSSMGIAVMSLVFAYVCLLDFAPFVARFDSSIADSLDSHFLRFISLVRPQVSLYRLNECVCKCLNVTGADGSEF